jgi:hypothetical protein
LEANGFMEEGIPHGLWEFKSGQLNFDGNAKLKNFSFVVPASGEEVLLQSFLESGTPVGHLALYARNIDKSFVKDTIFNARLLKSDKNHFSGVSVQNDGFLLEGQLSKNAFMQGTWTLWKLDQNGDRNSLEEEWIFDNGLLLKKIWHSGNEGSLELNFVENTNSGKMVEDMDFSSRYLDIVEFIVDAKNTGRDEKVQFDREKFTHLQKLLMYVAQLQPSVSLILEKGIDLNLNVKLEVFPFIEEEINALKKVAQNIGSIQEKTYNLKNSPKVVLLQKTSPKAEEYLEILDAINIQKVDVMVDIINLYNANVLKYIDRENYISQVLDFEEEIEYMFLNSAKNYKFKNDKSLEGKGNIYKMMSLSEIINTEVDTIKVLLDRLVFEIEQEESLLLLESQLLDAFEDVLKQIKQLENNEVNNLAAYYVYEPLEQLMNAEMVKYKDLPTNASKKEAILPFIECIEAMGFLVNKLETLPRNFAIIDEAYIRQVFNPYTFTNMEERISPAVFNAFQNTLLPSLLGKIKTIQCSMLEKHRSEYDILFQGMIDLLSTDTKRLERRVKKMREPQKIVDLLNIEINFN